MYESEHHLGCLTSKVKPIGTCLSGCVTPVGPFITGCVSRMPGNGLVGSASLVESGLKGYVSLACSVNGGTTLCWMWDAGDNLCWDNLEYIALD